MDIILRARCISEVYILSSAPWFGQSSHMRSYVAVAGEEPDLRLTWEGLGVGIRVSKSFKVAPGVRVRVNTKSTSVSLGGKGMRYTVNSKGRRTTTVRAPGTGVSAQ